MKDEKMQDADMKARLKELYLPPAKDFVTVDVPEMRFVMIDGQGAEDRAALDRAVKWLFAAIYPLKRIARERMGKSFVEPPLEGLWWAARGNPIASAHAGSARAERIISPGLSIRL